MTIKNFEELEGWKKARELTSLIYSLTKKTSFSKDFGLREQIQRAAVSCMSNIAEGFDSDTDQQFIQFLGYSKRSASEVQSLLYAAVDNKYIDKEEFAVSYAAAASVRKLCSGFMKYLKKTGDRRPETGG
jgi:four helix bundle protein